MKGIKKGELAKVLGGRDAKSLELKNIGAGPDRGRIPRLMIGQAVIKACERGKSPSGIVMVSDQSQLLDDRTYYYVVVDCSEQYWLQDQIMPSPIRPGMQVLMNPQFAQPHEHMMDLPRGHFLVQINHVEAYYDAPLDPVPEAEPEPKRIAADGEGESTPTLTDVPVGALAEGNSATANEGATAG